MKQRKHYVKHGEAEKVVYGFNNIKTSSITRMHPHQIGVKANEAWTNRNQDNLSGFNTIRTGKGTPFT